MAGEDTFQTGESPVMVVGAGPTGLLLAIELLRRGVAVRLIDRLPKPVEWSQAIFIKQRTIEILASLGLAERFIAEGQWVRRVTFHSEGRQLAAYEFKNIDSPFQNMLSISESDTIHLLTERFIELGGRVEYATEFVGLAQDADGVDVTVRSTDEGVTTRRAAWVVGTDGYHSAVREAIGDDFDGRNYPELWGVFDTRLTEWPRARDTVHAQLDTPLVLPFPLGADRWRIYFRTDVAEPGVPEPVMARLRALEPDVGLADPQPPQYFHSHSKLARTFQIGRVLLAGDAAHASNPIQGHGMNAGIQDAHNLGWKLAAVVNGRGTEALLASYDAERRAVDGEIVHAGDEAYAWITDATGEGLAELYTFLSTSEGRAVAAMAETEIGLCYPQSPMVCEGMSEGTAVGARLGDAAGLLGPEGATSLHQLLAHPGPTVLLLGADAAPETVREMAAAIAPVLDGFDDIAFLTVTRGAPAIASGTLEDSEGLLHKRLGVDAPTLVVIRPDGFVSLCCAPGELERLATHLGRMYRAGTGQPG
ncbi:FAD-dependent monooxygenase [Acuticoccus kandeliae]|uniref:FAD-dependent monooxygenase n=1 Tax=Acuticoccus kandeliae TaxID=2073160 RepID=UPI00147306B7|nr:FAD-dependent monooxygenase [Acuticoccus kandeliae]